MISSPSEQLKAELLELIRNCAPGTRLPTERDLVAQHHLSRSTVNKVIVELEKERYVQRRIGSGTYVVPRDSKIEYADGLSGMAGRVSGEIIIVYPNFFAETLWNMVDQAEQLALKYNFKLTPVKLQPQTDYTLLYSLVERSTELQGILLIPPGEGIPESVYQWLLKTGKPVIAIDQVVDFDLPGLCGISGNQFQQGYLLMEELLENGHRNIGYVANEPFTPSRKELLRGIKQALYDRKIRWKDIPKSPMTSTSWHSSFDTGYLGTGPLLEAHPELTAIFYDTHPGAMAGLAALAESGRRCPDDISIIATSELTGWGNYTVPPLTIVSYPVRALIDKAFEVLLSSDREFPARIFIDAHINRRASIRRLLP